MATISAAEKVQLEEILKVALTIRDEVRGSLSLQAVGGSHIANDLNGASAKLKALIDAATVA